MRVRARIHGSRAGAASFLLLAFGALLAVGAKSAPPRVPGQREVALHVLNRLGFGPGPGELDRVLEIGVARYVQEQLHPGEIDDAAVERRLADLGTLRMTTADLIETFEKPIREARVLRREALRGQPMEPGEADDYRQMIPPSRRPRRIVEELSAARVLRAVYSRRQLNEVLVDFWMNHFNVSAAKGLDRVFLTSFERDVVRPRIWGKFEDLLMATAKSPAMLFYLDNARSVAEEANRRQVVRNRVRLFGARPNAPTGINENYARELMELHTLGVDGGYAQKDVTELARALTGWSIDRPGEGADFVFRAAMHDVQPKTVLGHAFPAGGGLDEGESLIRILAHHPSTAHHIAYELAQRLVADDPPKALVERAARTFRASDGDLRETVRTIVESPEFFDPAYFHSKVKSPFEYVVSAVRAVKGETDARALVGEIAQMGEPLYLCQPPTGYGNKGSAWVNSGALVERMNFALALTSGNVPGTAADVEALVPPAEARDPERSVEALARVLTGGELSCDTEATIAARIGTAAGGPGAQPKTPLRLIAGLVLGSPDFQKE
jgi:uncharacterized protein (DUF1800 family)